MVKGTVIPCTKEEMDALIKAASGDDFFYMLFKVARKTGRRIGEYWDVKVSDIDYDKKLMMTKVLKRRRKVVKEAILDDELVYLIQRYATQNHLKLDDYLFRKVSIRQISNKVKQYAEEAGIDHNVSFHNFRHYFVTGLVKKGWDYNKISKLTGHSNPGTLTAYDHMVAEDIADDARNVINEI
jgi:integrase/recombinase XerD